MRSSARWACAIVPGTSPAQMRLCGPVHGDRTRQAAELRLIRDDRPADGRLGPLARGRRVQPPFGVPQACFDALELAAVQQAPRHSGR